MTTTVDKAISAMTKNSSKGPVRGTTAAEALSALPKVKGPTKRVPTPKTADTPTKAPLDPVVVRRADPVVVQQVEAHDNEGDSRLALRNTDTGEFASKADARREPEKIVTDFVENRKAAPEKKAPAKKAVAKKAPAKKAAAKKTVAKKAPAKKATKKVAKKK